MGQTRDSFVHVAVHLLDGRSDEQKTMLSEAILARIEPMLPAVVSVGVEIVDIHRASYRKRVLG
jgi:5-carboxymethyl-2-hydroxymuconate isomerase